jgi:predicted phosphodiesterase
MNNKPLKKNINFRFGIVSDLHIALPNTIADTPRRFHLVEVSVPALEKALAHFETMDLDFILIPGDLTQNGEVDNHRWLQKRLQSLSFPAYVIPGNHDIPYLASKNGSIACGDFPSYYRNFGYQNTEKLYYSCEVFPGVQLIALNSNQFDRIGNQLGCLDEEQLKWLEETLALAEVENKLVLVTIHHNVIEHIPGQSHHELGKRYMLDNASALLKILRTYKVKLIFSGHLHVQDLVESDGIYEITTGSLVSYPHPYRVVEFTSNDRHSTTDKADRQEQELKINSYRVENVPGWDNLAATSKQVMGDRSYPFMLKLLTSPPINLPIELAEKIAPQLRYFWADIAAGDTFFDFPNLPLPAKNYLQKFGAIAADGTHAAIDNDTVLKLDLLQK